MNPPTSEHVCGYEHCGVSLTGMSLKAVYCCRAHKERAKRLRNRQTAEPAKRTTVCSICGATVAVEPISGRLPKYCPAYHPKQHCAGCGKLLGHHAVSKHCRDCTPKKDQPAPTRTWTCLCDECGSIFEGPAGAPFCPKYEKK